MSNAASEVTWLIKVLHELAVSSLKPVTLFVTINYQYILQRTMFSIIEKNSYNFQV